VATLELYLIRHGVAAERGEDFPDDSKRPLTHTGISRLKKKKRRRSKRWASVSITSLQARSFARDKQPTCSPKR